MWLKAQNEMAGLWPHAAMGPVERMVRRQSLGDGTGIQQSASRGPVLQVYPLVSANPLRTENSPPRFDLSIAIAPPASINKNVEGSGTG